MKCIVCRTQKAVHHSALGWLPCSACRTRGKARRGLTYEFAPQSVKDSRKEFHKDILQSSRDGIISKERLDVYGEKGLKLTDEQRKNARYVWGGTPGYEYTEKREGVI